MPTRLLLDGEDLPALMLRVREEMGPGARIIKAERIRTGGVAGFFAKEHYELTVEVPDPGRPRRRRPAPRAAPGSAPQGIDALLAAAEAAEEADGPDYLADAPGPGPVDAAARPDGDAGEADATAEAEPPGPQVSTAGDTFAKVLESMRQMVGPPPVAPAAEVLSAEVPPVPLSAEPDQVPADSDPEPTPTSLDEGLALALPAVAPSTLSPVPGLEPPRSGSNVTSLLELGIPTRLLAGFADPHASVPLSVLVRRFDAPPTLWLVPGRIVAVVGDGNDALATARQMAHRAGTDPFDIVLAGEMDAVTGHGRRLQTVAAVTRYRTRISRDVPAIVALGVGPGRDGWESAAELLGALEPSQAWAVLDARRKAVDLRRWLRAVGSRRQLDAIAATGTFEAQAPGTVLNVGTPVGWVDGLPASPVVWAAVLSERLADDARWD